VTYPRVIVRTIAFLWGMQFAFLSPALALLLVTLFGASTGQVAAVLVIYNGASLVAAWALPRWADRRSDYVRPMFGCAVFTVALSVVLIFAESLWAGVIGLVLLGAPAAVGTPLLFGYVRHSGAPPSDVVQTRAVFSMAWVAGPPLAAVIIAGAGGHALVFGIGIVGVLNMAAIALLYGRGVAAVAGAPVAGGRSSLAPRPAIALLVAAFAGIQATNSASVAITTLFATHTLHLSAIWGGVALGVAAALEVPALFLLGRPSRRMGDLTLLSLACLVGVAYYLSMSVVLGGFALIAVQVLNAGFYAVIAGVGLTLFQAIIAGPGAAAGLLANSQRAGALLAGPLIGLGSFLAGGLRGVFVACAIVTGLSLVLLRLAARRMPASVSEPHELAAAAVPADRGLDPG
jgi:SET family sugar efflux transporter-like MFS transporter